jgi:hypothetical protein
MHYAYTASRPVVAMLLMLLNAADFENRDLFRFMNLVRGQPDTVVLFHSDDHVIDELLHRLACELARRNRLCHVAQHRMSQPGHFQNRYKISLT